MKTYLKGNSTMCRMHIALWSARPNSCSIHASIPTFGDVFTDALSEKKENS